MTNDLELLRETVATLERQRVESERRRAETEALLEGLGAVLQAGGVAEAVDAMFTAFRRVIPITDGFILRDDGDRFAAVAATCPLLLEVDWPAGEFTERILGGEILLSFDFAQVPKWARQRPEIRALGTSALVAPFHVEGHPGILVMLSRTRGAFTREHRQLLRRFSLLAGQTAVQIEAQRLRRESDALRAARDEAERLRHAAEAASRAKTDFLAVMSHEIRTPLNGVLGIASLLEQSALDDEQQTLVRTLRESGESLAVIVDDILDFSAVEAGKLKLTPAAFSLSDLVASVVRLLQPRADARGIALEATFPPALDRSYEQDPLRLRQVLLNLVGNAIKFTETGSVRLVVEAPLTLARPGEAERLRFRVIDTGCGIPAAALPRLFNRFEQVDSSSTRRYGGTGLGLAIVKRLVELMGGSVGVRSVEGSGSEFWAEVPCRVVERGPRRGSDHASAAPARPLRVLVVEDHPVNQLVMREALARLGHESQLAVDGVSAVEAAGAAPFDLILMDLQMPVMDGEEATRRIRAGGGPNARTRIVALSAEVTGDVVARCEAAGFDGYASKPITVTRLRELLQHPEDGVPDEMHAA